MTYHDCTMPVDVAAEISAGSKINPNFPVTSFQRKVFFAESGDKNPGVNTEQIVCDFTESIDSALFERAWSKIVARHAALRSRFLQTDGEPCQNIQDQIQLPWAFRDWSQLAAKEIDRPFRLLLWDDRRKGFNLADGPLFRLTLLRLGRARYRFVFSYHRLILDRRSQAIVLKEALVLYDALRTGAAFKFPPVPSFGSDSDSSGGLLPVDQSFWEEHLRGYRTQVSLPAGQSKKGKISPASRHGEIRLELSPDATSQLNSLAEQLGVSTATISTAAWAVLLARYADVDDIIVGTSLTHASTPEAMVGCGSSVVPFRIRIEEELKVGDWLKKIHASAEVHAGHARDSLKAVDDCIDLEANQSLFENIIIYRRTEWSDGLRSAVSAGKERHFTLEQQWSEPLVIDVQSAPVFQARLLYHRTRIADEVAEQLISSYRTILRGIASNVEGRVHDLPTMTGAEINRVYREWNRTHVQFPSKVALHVLFEEQVKKTPYHLALKQGHRELMYAELNAHANRIAAQLILNGSANGERVAIVFRRSSPEWIVACLATLKAGAMGVLLEAGGFAPTNVPFFRLALGAPLDRERFPANTRFVEIDLNVHVTESDSETNPSKRPATTAFVVSTADQSRAAVHITQRALGNLVAWHQRVYHVVGRDRASLYSSGPAYCALWEVWPYLTAGASVHIPAPAESSAQKRLAQWLLDQKITLTTLPSSVVEDLYEEQWTSAPALRAILATGIVARGRPRNGFACPIISHYGFAQCSGVASWAPVPATSTGDLAPVIGRPIANTKLYVLDRRLRPAPPFGRGELYVGGEGLAAQVDEDFGSADARLVASPLERSAKTRLFRTGDKVRWLNNGSVELLSAPDRQVDHGGHLVRLAEIEAAFKKDPRVAEAAVVRTRNDIAHRGLTAFLVPPPDRMITESAARGIARQHLVPEKNPTHIVILPRLPRTERGDIDFARLRERAANEESSTRALNPTERRLLDILGRMVSGAPVLITDRLSDLGAPSELAFKLVERIEREFGRRLLTSTIIRAHSLRELAGIISRGRKDSSDGLIVAVQAKGTMPPLYLVHGVGGGMFWGYANLSRHLGDDQPVYAIQSRGSNGEEEYATIEEMAARYVEELKDFQPAGPYCLGGYCFGGNIAYEMARQLEEQGDVVSVLAVFNSAPPNSSYNVMGWSPVTLFKFAKNFFYWTKHFLHWEKAARKQFFAWKCRSLKKSIARRIGKHGPGNADVEKHVDLAGIPEQQRVLWEAHIRALTTYRCGTYSGAVSLFRTKGHPLFCSFDYQYGWEEYALGGVSTSIVSGVHELLMDEPHVQTLATELKIHLDAAHRDAGNLS